ncbi:MAG: VOC family protein [Pseudomonadota bacterium]|nr:VOC family protein [Pseudomonadota bacterium]
MPLTELNHFFVRCNDLERSKDWYCKMLGFEEMPRPPFPFKGYWLGINGKIQIHMGQHGVANSELYYLGSPPDAAISNTGVVDHIAFLADKPDEFRQRFESMKMDYRERALPDFDLYQMFFKDPDGLTIELNFFGLKNQGDWGGEDYSKMPKT